MTCTITNIARFASAELTLSGLTVLSGTNGSGMTTIAKALYAAVKSEIALSHDGRFSGDCSHIITPPCVEDSPANRRLAERAFSAEFGGQLANFTHPEKMSQVLCGASRFTFSEGVCTSCRIAEPTFQNVIFLDDASVIEAQCVEEDDAVASRPFFSDHRQDLMAVLYGIVQKEKREGTEDIVLEETPATVLEGLLGGRLAYCIEKERFVYREAAREQALCTMGSGNKALALLELLLRRGCIHGSTFLIIDEPEAHLHPQWQIQMAHLLVSLAEHTPVKILINTKSPYIVEAVRVYSEVLGIEDTARFYHVVETGVFESSLQDVSDDISPIYEELAEPYRMLDSVYGSASDL